MFVDVSALGNIGIDKLLDAVLLTELGQLRCWI